MSLTNEEYTQRIEKLFNRNKKLLLKKRQEYSPNTDPLQNFKDGAEISGNYPEEILWFYCLKHITSIRDIIFNRGLSSVDVKKELLEEKTGDIINYMILLNLLKDDYEKEYKMCKP